MIKIKIFYSVGVLITGSDNTLPQPSDTAELYLPSSNVSCSLPRLPDVRWHHSMESWGLLCGGDGIASDTCLQWSPDTGTWEELLTLDDERLDHVSWTPVTGVGTYLMGCYGTELKRTSTLITPDGTQEPGFPLKYDTR